MKSKKIIALTLMGLLSLGGVKAYAGVMNDKILKDTLMTEAKVQVREKKAVKEDKNSEELSKEKAAETLKEGVEKYFKVKIDTNKLSRDIRPVYGNEDEVVEWIVYWRDKPLNEEWKLEDTSILYGGSVDIKTGKILSVMAFNGDRDKKVNNMSVEELKDMSVDFIKEFKLVEDIEGLKFLGESVFTQSDKEIDLVFSHSDKVNEVIYISIDLVNKKACGLSSGTLDGVVIKD